jgi:hypothetical protein
MHVSRRLLPKPERNRFCSMLRQKRRPVGGRQRLPIVRDDLVGVGVVTELVFEAAHNAFHEPLIQYR